MAETIRLALIDYWRFSLISDWLRCLHVPLFKVLASLFPVVHCLLLFWLIPFGVAFSVRWLASHPPKHVRLFGLDFGRCLCWECFGLGLRVIMCTNLPRLGNR